MKKAVKIAIAVGLAVLFIACGTEETAEDEDVPADTSDVWGN